MFNPLKSPLGGVGQIILCSSDSPINPHIYACQIWLQSDGRVKKRGGTDRQTHIQRDKLLAALVDTVYVYTLYSGSFHVKSTDGFHGPPPILLKFGTLVGIV